MEKDKLFNLTERMVKAVLPSCLFFFLLCTFIPLMAGAHTVATDSVRKDPVAQLEDLSKQVDKKLTAHYYKTKYDTNYVARPHQKWLFRFLASYTGSFIHAKGTVNGIHSDYDLHTRGNKSLSLEVNYCDVAVALSFSPDKHDDHVFNFEYYGQRFSFNFNYQRATSLGGDMKWGDKKHLGDDGLLMKMYNVTGYYTFNHRQFSFPAALNQNYFQRRSAGSWLVGVSVQAGSIKTTDEMKQHAPKAPEMKLTFGNVGIGGGYGYNWALGRRSQWLLHLSVLPAFVLYKHNTLNVNNYEVTDKAASLNLIFNERAAVVYHFSPKYNVGATFNMSNPLFKDDKVVVKQTKWMARAFFGLRL